ncbi:MAG: hypothetical protein KA945_00645 [Zoogloea sp.]|nr:hypothetical protein [Zoogloea sp.]
MAWIRAGAMGATAAAGSLEVEDSRLDGMGNLRGMTSKNTKQNNHDGFILLAKNRYANKNTVFF